MENEQNFSAESLLCENGPFGAVVHNKSNEILAYRL